jgi:dihydrofolate reductase
VKLIPAKPHIALVIAVAENGVIGRAGGLPWRMSSDMKTFRRLTMGKPMIMGRKTWQSLPRKPLDGRDNIVVSRDPAFVPEGEHADVHVVRSYGEALDLARRRAAERGVDEITVIGGAQIYLSALPSADRIYLTRVHARPEGDVTLDGFNETEWREVSRTELAQGERDEFPATLLILERKAL